MLEDSLGGNCVTTMCCMVSPAYEAFQESLTTLKFANRCKKITNYAGQNVVLTEAQKQEELIQSYKNEINALKTQVVDRDVMINELQVLA